MNGIRPMTIERLLAFLGYDMNAPIVGRAEAVDSRRHAAHHRAAARHRTPAAKAASEPPRPRRSR